MPFHSNRHQPLELLEEPEERRLRHREPGPELEVPGQWELQQLLLGVMEQKLKEVERARNDRLQTPWMAPEVGDRRHHL